MSAPKAANRPKKARLVIGIVPHLARMEARRAARSTAASLEASGVEVRVPASDAVRVGLDEWAVPDDEFAKGLSYAFSLGGDGTMLRTVDLVCADGVPVVGVNVGHLGYLASEHLSDIDVVVERVLRGDHGIEERMMLDIVVSAPRHRVRRFAALNDAVLEKSNAGNTVRLSVSFNDVPFADYSADGVIVATPTGSTAYAFSVRGPIVSPLMRALVVVPISPHMLFDRSLVLSADETVRLEVLDGRTATLFVDGRDEGAVPGGAVVTCAAHPQPARLVTFGPRDFHGILKTKFELPGPGTRARERFEAEGDTAEGDTAEVTAPDPRVARGRRAR